jgi:hypothetical protein
MIYEVQPRASYCTQLIVWEHQAYGLSDTQEHDL